MADSDFVPGYDTCNKVTPQCPIEATLYGEYFSKPPVAFFAAAFGLLLLYQIWSAFKLRAWGFSIWLCLGTIFETVGYISRVEMADNPWKKDAFQKQLVLLIVGPRLIAAAIAITFKHLVLYYNPSLSILRPRWYPFVFVGTDIIAIILQGAGAVLAGQGHDLADVSTGLLIGGVSFQLVDMLECGLLMVVYWRVRWFVWAIIAAYILIIVRCVYRVPEMAMGWGSSLMQNETLFLILDGAMILLAVTILCAFHPALFFPRLGKSESMDATTPADLARHCGMDDSVGVVTMEQLQQSSHMGI